MRLVKKPQIDDAKKKRSVSELNEVTALSWTSEEDDEESNASADINASLMDHANFEAAKNQVSNWIASIRTPLRQSGINQVNLSLVEKGRFASTHLRRMTGKTTQKHNLRYML